MIGFVNGIFELYACLRNRMRQQDRNTYILPGWNGLMNERYGDRLIYVSCLVSGKVLNGKCSLERAKITFKIIAYTSV